MNTTLHSFIDIFDAEFILDEESVQLKKIVIPSIQRDYAQGRIDEDINRVRERFLNSLYHAIIATPITLDFVYGDIDENGIMTPLDGQQRLTTLFLLHWYAAKKENVAHEKYAFLRNFSYETRYSTRYFCTELIDFNPSFEIDLSVDIKNQSWFPWDWNKDPSIHSMLVMLDAIDHKFKNVPNIWNCLENQAITFYFLPIKDMGLTDELYIKMNSRGKPLTLFEHFKAELEGEIRVLDEKTGEKNADRIMASIDKTWTDLLWDYRKSSSRDSEDAIIDDKFLRYFHFICDIICYKKGESPQNRSNDVFDLLQQYFSAQKEDTPANLTILESFFNCWCNIDGFENPAMFLTSFMGYQHEPGKIMIDSKYKLDIFEDCINSYSDKSGRARQFPLNRMILLYAITIYLQNQENIKTADFAKRIRVVNNLIQNSQDEISDRLERNRIPAILQAVDSIILTGIINDTLDNNFNVNQIQEEKEKALFLTNHPEYAEDVYTLEDHKMLKGQISIIGLDHLTYGPRFASLFSCSWDKVDCALMAKGNYGQRENRWRFQYASKYLQSAWDELFHKSGNYGFENTHNILISLLSTNESFDNEILEGIAKDYMTQCEKEKLYPWNYYYIKYDSFRPGRFGKLSNWEALEKPYLFNVMQTPSVRSQTTYMPYLKEADPTHLSTDHMGQRLIYEDVYIICENDAYDIYNNNDDSFVDTIKISQNDKFIDTEDRIIKLKEYLQKNLL